MVELGIIADDLTGAMDTGVQFAKGGLHTVVMLAEGELPPAEMAVVSTDSRDLPAEESRRKTREAARRFGDRAVYKKIDSTLRGNLGPELEGLLEGLGLERALVAPAFPSNGRTTVGGYHLVHGTPLAESSFAGDPLWPARESHLPTLLAKQTSLSVGYLPLSTVEQGAGAVARALRAERADIVAADAETPAHLRTLALAVAQLEGWLPCGSAGLAEEWPRALGLERPRALFRWPEDPRPALVVAGSRHQVTAEQLKRASEEGRLVLVPLGARGEGDAEAVDRAIALLNQGRSVAITTAFSRFQQGQGVATALGLAEAAGAVLSRSPMAGLFMTGGDIARALCSILGAGAIRALGEVQPGVPAGLLMGGAHDGLRVVTKAGGFGDERAIIQSIDCLRGRQT